ncbi:universal stress protein [Halalkalicoccus salilacus]|uniref:universal stress protein n=1 Tax=Halalkalicoccus salilacus TaxID=3117459 RepID=UPI00300EE52A
MDRPARVLVPLDGSPLADEALEHALVVFPQATVTVLNVITPIDAGMSEGGLLEPDDDRRVHARERAEALVERTARRTSKFDASVEVAIEDGDPATVILEFVDEANVDHVVMGGHGRSDLAARFLGSVATSVVTRSPVPVTVVR